MKIRIGICDDSDHDRHYLKSIIKNYFKGREIEPEIVEYGSGEEFFRKPDVEILFLDIEMNALDGIMVKNELQKLQAETRIVFTTSHNDLMRDAFGKQVFGFLVKRVSPKEVEKYLNAILKDLEEENCVLIKGAEKETFVTEKQILYIKAETKYCDIILENQDSMFSDKSIGEWAEKLEERGFFLCHRSYLVNLYHLKKIEDDILLSNGEKIPVSRRLKTKVKEAYREYIRKKVR